VPWLSGFCWVLWLERVVYGVSVCAAWVVGLVAVGSFPLSAVGVWVGLLGWGCVDWGMGAFMSYRLAVLPE